MHNLIEVILDDLNTELNHAEAREQLQSDLNNCDPDAADLCEADHWSVEEVLEAVHGEEFFWEEL